MLARLLAALPLLLGLAAPAGAGHHDPVAWQRMLEAARGQTVRLSATAAPQVTRLLGWAREELRYRFGIELVAVPVEGPGEMVARLAAERAAGTGPGGVDLVWVGGRFLAAMQAETLLAEAPWADRLPHADKLAPDVPAPESGPLAGRASPWGLARLSLFHDAARLPEPPRSVGALGAWAQANPGRFAYPAPPSRLGTSFLAQMLLALGGQPEFLHRPAIAAEVEPRLAPLWDWLERMHPYLWGAGTRFPDSAQALQALFERGEIDIGMTVNPGEASARIAAGTLPASVRSFVLAEGSIASAHFLVIPFNAPAPVAAMVVADFLLSPEAQAHKADETVWGDPSVLDYGALNAEGRALFDTLPQGPATLRERERGSLLAEPHPSWMEAIAQGWRRRYGDGR